MPNPTISDLHLDRPLTNLSVLYSNEMTNTVHDKVFPVVPVQKRSDKYFTYDVRDFFRTEAKSRAPGAEIAIGGWNISTDNYYCERDGIGHDIDDPTRANADAAVANLDGDAVRWITEQLALKAEKDWVTNFFSSGVWDGASSTADMTGSSTAPGSTAAEFLHWNDAASTPIEDIRGEMTAILKRTGRKPNTLVLGMEVWTALADHPDMLDRIKYTQTGIVTEDLLASLLGLNRVLVGSMVEDTASAEGSSAAGVMSFVAGKNVLLAHVAPSPGLRVPSAGYTFSWTGMPGAPTAGAGARIKRYRLERNESDRIEGEHWKDYKVIGSSLGAFFVGAVA
jgi:hypothetical protein